MTNTPVLNDHTEFKIVYILVNLFSLSTRMLFQVRNSVANDFASEWGKATADVGSFLLLTGILGINVSSKFINKPSWS